MRRKEAPAPQLTDEQRVTLAELAAAMPASRVELREYVERRPLVRGLMMIGYALRLEDDARVERYIRTALAGEDFS